MTGESKNKLQLLRNLLVEQGAEGIYIGRRDNFAWLTGGKQNYVSRGTEIGASGLLVTDSAVYCVANTIEMPRILAEELQDFECQHLVYDWYRDDQCRVIEEAIHHKKLLSDCPIGQAVSCNDLIQPFKLSLCSEEISRYREVCRGTALAVEQACSELARGMTEHEISAIMARHAIEQGIDAEVLLVATDERIHQYRHPIPTEKRLDRYAMLVICGRKYGLDASVTRLVSIGPVPEEIQYKYNALLQVEVEMLAATRPGTQIRDIFDLCTQMYREVGFETEWTMHHQGGAAGYASREYIAMPSSRQVVQTHQAFAWNPTISGTKVEDTILSCENGVEILSHTGKWKYTKLTSKNGTNFVRPQILTI